MKELVYHRVLLPMIERHADKVAFHNGPYSGTYEEHGQRTFQLHQALRTELGLGPGDRFAVMATNSHQFLELYHAAFLGAGVINPLNLRLAGADLEYIVRDSGTEVVFVDEMFAQHFADALAASDEPSPIRHTVLIGEGDYPHDVTYETLISSAEPEVPPEPDEDDLAVLMYTGGTTGLPKGVALTHRAEMLNLYHLIMSIGFGDDSVFLHQVPMFHAASMPGTAGIPGSGGSSVFMPFFDPGGALDLIEKHGVTQTVMVPTMIGMMLSHPDFEPGRLDSLRKLGYGASPMPSALLDRLIETCPDLEITQGYGMTECSAVLTLLMPDDHRAGGSRLQSAGRPLPGVVLSIRDDAGREVPTGETGEVCAKAGNFMREYWNRPDATEEAFRDGWYRTGDAGYLDEQGYLFLVDRVKDMIVSGGENVYSAEVESVLSRHEAIEQVAVIGIPSDTWGEQVHAIVVRRAEASVTVAELQDFAREQIAAYKVPKSIEFRDEPMPLSGAMKILKRELRKPYWDDHDRGVG